MSDRFRPAGSARTGAVEFEVALRLALVTWLALAALQLLLFLRPSPYGTPYVVFPWRYLPFAIVWDLWAAMLPAVPFLAAWIIGWERESVPSRSRRAHLTLLALLMFVTLLEQVDHELMRFMGIHLSWSVVRTYYNVTDWPDDMYALLGGDRGGPWLSLALVPLLLTGLALAGSRILRGERGGRQPATRLGAAGLTVALLVAPGTTFLVAKGSNRWRRVQPALFGVVRETMRAAKANPRPGDFAQLVGDYRRGWLAGQAGNDWRFTDSAYPLVRVPATVSGPVHPRWNVILLQLETFRGWDTGFLRPDRPFSPTPFLDSLANDPSNGAWVRHLSFGPETVNGLFSSQCSVKPHRNFSPTAMFRGTAFLCLPDLLRHHGWRAAVVTGIDPDWDFQTPWLRAWYDELSLPEGVEEPDRVTFRRAAKVAGWLGREPEPFLLTVISYSNHVPFRSREPALDLVKSSRPDSAIWNTMHYTDDVLREFVGAIRGEPWFGHTLLVVTGDHGANLGEHDGSAGQRNGWRETVWVPLVIAGHHPRLPPGHHAGVASLLDIAPTIIDLLGIRDTVPWMGHSLADSTPPGRQFCGVRADAAFAERGRWSFVADPASGRLLLYDALQDPLQRTDLAPDFPDTAAGLADCVREEQALTDYLLVHDRIWPDRPAQ